MRRKYSCLQRDNSDQREEQDKSSIKGKIRGRHSMCTSFLSSTGMTQRKDNERERVMMT
jgi:hypothetical protein